MIRVMAQNIDELVLPYSTFHEQVNAIHLARKSATVKAMSVKPES